MTSKESIDILTIAVSTRGHYTHICPESLEDLLDYAKQWGWGAVTPAIPAHTLHTAFNEFIASMRVLLDPV